MKKSLIITFGIIINCNSSSFSTNHLLWIVLTWALSQSTRRDLMAAMNDATIHLYIFFLFSAVYCFTANRAGVRVSRVVSGQQIVGLDRGRC